MRNVLAAFVVSRLFVALFVYWGHWNHPYLAPVYAGYPGVAHWWLNPWTYFDTRWYLSMATHGYQPETSVFFPLYPALLQISQNPVTVAAWGVLLSNGCLLLGLGTLHELTRRDFDEPTAQWAVWFTALCPTAAVFSSVYTESLFLPLLCGVFLALRTQRFAWCAALGFCAGLARNAAPLIAVALLVEAFVAYRKGADWKPIVACAFAPVLSFVWVQQYVGARFGKGIMLATQIRYGRVWNPPWVPIWRDIVGFATLDGITLPFLLNFVATVGVIPLLWYYRKRVPASYSILILGIVAANLVLAHSTPPFTNSTLRYLSTCFPFVQLLALSCAPLRTNRVRTLMLFAMLAIGCALFSYGIGNKQYIMG